MGQRPHLDHGLYSRANPRVVSAGAFDSADSSADVLQARVLPSIGPCMDMAVLLVPSENMFQNIIDDQKSTRTYNNAIS
jgi:hypothetical protein